MSFLITSAVDLFLIPEKDKKYTHSQVTTFQDKNRKPLTLERVYAERKKKPRKLHQGKWLKHKQQLQIYTVYDPLKKR